MLTIVKGQFMAIGEYDFEVEGRTADGSKVKYRPRFVDLYSTDSGLVRFSIERECSVPESIPPLAYVACYGSATNSERSVRGEDRDRVMKSVKVKFERIELQADLNGQLADEFEVAAA